MLASLLLEVYPSPMNRNVDIPSFTVENDPVGLGWRIAVRWPDGRIEYVTGMGTEDQALQWIINDAPQWVMDPDRLTTPKT